MSDVTVAPQQGAAPSAAPANEVVINQNPTPSQNPIGSQAPPAPTKDFEGSKHRPQSRSEGIRDSLKEALTRSEKIQPKPERPKAAVEAKSADAKPGHNHPPEETPKLNLKQRPDEQPARERAEHGHFAPRQDAQNALNAQNATSEIRGRPADATSEIRGQPEYKRLPPHAPFAEPPQRISESARRDWADTPETVRGDIHRMHHEFGRAYQQYRGAAEAFQPIAKYHQMAQQHGTTLEKALNNYTGIEQKLRADPLAGLETIVYNLGLTDPQSGKRIDLRDIAYTVLSQSPEQLQQLKMGNQQTAASQQIGALHQEIAGLKNYLGQMHNQQQFASKRSQVDQFAATHPRIDEQVFGTVVANELKLGFDLDTAYRRAELLVPATHAAQTGTTSAQTRPVDRSIHGNPDVAPSNGASRRPQKASGSAREAAQNAMNRYAGRA